MSTNTVYIKDLGNRKFSKKIADIALGIPDRDRTSQRKGVLEKLKYASIILVLIIIITVFFAKNNQNRLTYSSTALETQIPLPNVTFCLNSCASCIIQSFIVVNNFKDYNMFCSQPDITDCTFKDNVRFSTNNGLCFNIGGENFNIENLQEYWMISIHTKFVELYPQINFKTELSNSPDTEESSFPLLLHSENNLFFSKSIYQNKTGGEEITFTPFFQSVITASDKCADDPNKNCGILTLAIKMSSLMVLTNKEETDSMLAKRTLTDSASLISIVNITMGVIFSMVITRILFNNYSAWVEHNTREAVLYHMEQYMRDRELLVNQNQNFDH